MFGLFAQSPEMHFVDNGRVYCRVREADVEIDHCMCCRSLSESNLDANPPYVRCAPEVPLGFLIRRLV